MNQAELHIAEIFQALGHPNRLRIVEALRGGELCSCEVQPLLDLEQSNLSRHVKILVTAGILDARKDGFRLMLKVRDPRIFTIIDSAKKLTRSRLAALIGELE